MNPYYSDDLVTIYLGDCRDVLTGLIADVVVTDPPYNVGLAYGSGTDDDRSDYEAWCREWFGLCMASSSVVALTPGVANLAQWCRIAEPTWTMAWYKPAAMGRGGLGFNNWEPILVWGKPVGVPMSNDVIVAPIVPDVSVSGHPCPKPLKWATGLVGRLSAPGATVLDPFMGSGTTLVAAREMGRKSIGIEIEERYCEIAATRCSQEVLGLLA